MKFTVGAGVTQKLEKIVRSFLKKLRGGRDKSLLPLTRYNSPNWANLTFMLAYWWGIVAYWYETCICPSISCVTNTKAIRTIIILSIVLVRLERYTHLLRVDWWNGSYPLDCYNSLNTYGANNRSSLVLVLQLSYCQVEQKPNLRLWRHCPNNSWWKTCRVYVRHLWGE